MLVLVSGAARVLGSKFVDDLPLKADLAASRSHLDTCSWYCRHIIDESLIHVCNGWPYMNVLVSVWTWSWMNLFVWQMCTMMWYWTSMLNCSQMDFYFLSHLNDPVEPSIAKSIYNIKLSVAKDCYGLSVAINIAHNWWPIGKSDVCR